MADYQHLPANDSVNATVVVVEERYVVQRRRRRAGGCGCCACLALVFLLCYFLIPRKPTVKYIKTVLNAHDTADDNTTVKFTESTCAQSRAPRAKPPFPRSRMSPPTPTPNPPPLRPRPAPRTDKLQNNDYFSVEWSDPKLTISYWDPYVGEFVIIGQTWCNDAMPDYMLNACELDANMTSSTWSTGAKASKKITMPTTVYPLAAAAAIAECGLNGNVQLLSSGNIMMKSSGPLSGSERINVGNEFYWLYCN